MESVTQSPLIQVAIDRQLPPPKVAKAIRVAANVTQVEVAAECGVHEVTVQRWESGSRRPRGQAAERYGALLRGLSGMS